MRFCPDIFFSVDTSKDGLLGTLLWSMSQKTHRRELKNSTTQTTLKSHFPVKISQYGKGGEGWQPLHDCLRKASAE